MRKLREYKNHNFFKNKEIQICSHDELTIEELARLFGDNITYLPERKGDRKGSTKLKRDLLNENCISFFIVLSGFILGGFTCGRCSKAPLDIWIRVELIYYICNFIFCYTYFKWLIRSRHDSVKFIIFNCVLNVIHSGWLVYGNILFYKYFQSCSDEF